MADLSVTPDELVNEMQRQYPEQVRICVLTVINRKQAELITQQESAIKQMDPLLVRREDQSNV